jgi:hypothetical protein
MGRTPVRLFFCLLAHCRQENVALTLVAYSSRLISRPRCPGQPNQMWRVPTTKAYFNCIDGANVALRRPRFLLRNAHSSIVRCGSHSVVGEDGHSSHLSSIVFCSVCGQEFDNPSETAIPGSRRRFPVKPPNAGAQGIAPTNPLLLVGRT